MLCVNYFLAMDITYGAVFCFHCKDHIYDDELDEVAGVNSGFFGKYNLVAIAVGFVTLEI